MRTTSRSVPNALASSLNLRISFVLNCTVPFIAMNVTRPVLWHFSSDTIKNTDGIEIPVVSRIRACLWREDMREWPQVNPFDISNYFIDSCDVDGKEMKNYKSMESYQLFHALKVGTVVHYEVSPGLFYMKAEVSSKHSWLSISD